MPLRHRCIEPKPVDRGEKKVWPLQAQILMTFPFWKLQQCKVKGGNIIFSAVIIFLWIWCCVGCEDHLLFSSLLRLLVSLEPGEMGLNPSSAFITLLLNPLVGVNGYSGHIYCISDILGRPDVLYRAVPVNCCLNENTVFVLISFLYGSPYLPLFLETSCPYICFSHFLIYEENMT